MKKLRKKVNHAIMKMIECYVSLLYLYNYETNMRNVNLAAEQYL